MERKGREVWGVGWGGEWDCPEGVLAEKAGSGIYLGLSSIKCCGYRYSDTS